MSSLFKPRLLRIVENNAERLRVRIDIPSQKAERTSFVLSGLFIIATTIALTRGFWDVILLVGLPLYVCLIQLSARVSFLQASEEIIVDSEKNEIVKKTSSRVFPETSLARLSEIENVRAAHVIRSEPVVAHRAVRARISAYGSQHDMTPTKRDTWHVYLKRTEDRPNSSGQSILFSHSSSDVPLLHRIGREIARLARVDFIDDI